MILTFQEKLRRRVRQEQALQRLRAKSNPAPSHILPNSGASSASSTFSTNSATQINPVAMDLVENPFRNLVIGVTGHHGIFTHEELKRIIEEMGARFCRKVTRGCTHLITTAREVDNNGSKVIEAYNAYTCEIVSRNWLIDSRAAGIPLPETDYRVKPHNADDSSTYLIPGPTTGMRLLLYEYGDWEDDADDKRPGLEMFSRSQKIIIPAHRACQFKHEYSIAVDQFGHPWDAMLVHSSSRARSNDFVHLQLLVDKDQATFVSWACWGRIGENPQQLDTTPCDMDTAKQDFERRFYEQTGFSWWTRFWHPVREGKFRYIAPGYVSRDSDEDPFNMANAENIKYNIPAPECTLPESVQKVLALILNKEQLLATTASLEYDARKLPLGQLNKETLAQGYNVLKKLSGLITDPEISWMRHENSLTDVIRDLSSQYFSLIPHVFGKNQPPVISAESHIEKEMALLDDLANVVIANNILSSIDGSYVHPLEKELQELHLDEITPLKHKSTEFKQLSQYFRVTAIGQELHQVVEIFRIRRTGEEARFKAFIEANQILPNRRLLWHGSRTVNLAGILSQGLQIRPPGVQKNGSSLGRGIYFSDGANRSLAFTSSARPNDAAILLLCDVALGHPVNAGVAVRDQLPGTLSTISAEYYWSTGWKAAEAVHPSLAGVVMPDFRADLSALTSGGQYVVYDPAQVQIRYMVVVVRL